MNKHPVCLHNHEPVPFGLHIFLFYLKRPLFVLFAVAIIVSSAYILARFIDLKKVFVPGMWLASCVLYSPWSYYAYGAESLILIETMRGIHVELMYLDKVAVNHSKGSSLRSSEAIRNGYGPTLTTVHIIHHILMHYILPSTA